LLSKAMDGKPVKVTWTREDDIQHSYYHTVSVEHLEAGLDASGKPIAWLHRSAAPSFGSIFGPDPKHEQPYDARHGIGKCALCHSQPSPREPRGGGAHARRLVSLGVEHSARVRHSIVRRRARRSGGTRPKDYLLELIGPPRRIDPRKMSDPWNYTESPVLYPLDTGRLRRVIETAAQQAGWGKSMPAGRGLGNCSTLQLRVLRRRRH
jgi:isoquinoline 1-oxidoreductase beta subunit